MVCGIGFYGLGGDSTTAVCADCTVSPGPGAGYTTADDGSTSVDSCNRTSALCAVLACGACVGHEAVCGCAQPMHG